MIGKEAGLAAGDAVFGGGTGPSGRGNERARSEEDGRDAAVGSVGQIAVEFIGGLLEFRGLFFREDHDGVELRATLKIPFAVGVFIAGEEFGFGNLEGHSGGVNAEEVQVGAEKLLAGAGVVGTGGGRAWEDWKLLRAWVRCWGRGRRRSL